MDNLTDYILWMGEVPFSALPFNEADALVLSMLSYFDLSPLFTDPSTSELQVRDCQKLLDENQIRVLIAGHDRGYRRILDSAVHSRRFGELRITEYEDILRNDPPLQFAAMTFRGEGFSCLTFRGTDTSLAGWKEDFMISFTVTEAQELARTYAQRVMTEERDYYIAGHSKGGNLSLVAACSLDEMQLSRLRHLYLLDGPGLCPEVMDTDSLQRIDEKTTRILPTFSVIGMLFAPPIRDTRIVHSSASGFLQHGLDSWGIDHGKLFLADGPNPSSQWINEILAAWIGGISQEDRVIFVNELFDALSADGSQSLDDIEAKGVSGFEAILLKLLGSSEITKKTIYDLPRRAIFGDYYDEIMEKGLSGWLLERYLDWALPQKYERSSKAEKKEEQAQ